jgi:hypothetical protein
MALASFNRGYDSLALKVKLHLMKVKQLKFPKFIHKVTEDAEYSDEKWYIL